MCVHGTCAESGCQDHRGSDSQTPAPAQAPSCFSCFPSPMRTMASSPALDCNLGQSPYAQAQLVSPCPQPASHLMISFSFAISSAASAPVGESGSILGSSSCGVPPLHGVPPAPAASPAAGSVAWGSSLLLLGLDALFCLLPRAFVPCSVEPAPARSSVLLFLLLGRRGGAV